MDRFELIVCVGSGIHQTFVSEVGSVSVWCLVGIPQTFFFLFLRWIPDVFIVDFELNRCRRLNLLLLIRFQQEGVCEA
jgi:hypothetical protein